mmetsp:Transcript_20471/g.33446  ORF Transcript_20471/g.33446 Transcript_20471/m.33446 type:complete len:203 (+) Transcript_20471:212-820(+)
MTIDNIACVAVSCETSKDAVTASSVSETSVKISTSRSESRRAPSRKSYSAPSLKATILSCDSKKLSRRTVEFGYIPMESSCTCLASGIKSTEVEEKTMSIRTTAKITFFVMLSVIRRPMMLMLNVRSFSKSSFESFCVFPLITRLSVHVANLKIFNRRINLKSLPARAPTFAALPARASTNSFRPTPISVFSKLSTKKLISK